MNPNGKKEIAEAVTIAALSAAANALINFGVEEFKALRAQRQQDKARIEALEKALAEAKQESEKPDDPNRTA